ncbi:hypothetical protein DSECCO2_246760 [anaerobic digester metagenome]
MAPFSSTPFGEICSRLAVNRSASMAPTVRISSMPSCSLPTSDSSTLPLKIISPISATVAMVVPSLKVLLSITELPTSTGTVSTIPAMVERIMVLLADPAFLVMPSRIS